MLLQVSNFWRLVLTVVLEQQMQAAIHSAAHLDLPT